MKRTKKKKYNIKYLRKCDYCSKKVETKIKKKRFCSNRCKDKRIKKQKMIFRKQIVLDRGGKCEKCGYKKNLAALCFHHKNPKEKEMGLHASSLLMAKESQAKMKREIKKCLLLCSNCHMEIHYPKLNNWKKNLFL